MAHNPIHRGLDTLIDTGSPALGLLDAIFGEDDEGRIVDTQTDVDKLGVAIGVDQAVIESRGQETVDATSLSGSTTLSDIEQRNIAETSAIGTETAEGVISTTGKETELGLQTALGETTKTGQEVSAGVTTGEVSTGAFTTESGLGTSGFNPETGEFKSALSAPFAENQGAALGASTGAFNQLSGSSFNDTIAARFNALEALQEQDRLQANLDLEDRLFSQGRLGSSGGALQQNALLDAIAQQQAQNQITAFDQATAERAQLGDEATAFGAAALAPEALSIEALQATGALAPQLSKDVVDQTIRTEEAGTTALDTTSANVITSAEDVLSTDISTSALDTTSESIQSELGLIDTTAFTDTTRLTQTDESQTSLAESIDIEQQQARETIVAI